MPCKHMFAVAAHIRDIDIPGKFLNSPWNTLDFAIQSFVEPGSQSEECLDDIPMMEEVPEGIQAALQNQGLLKRTAMSCREKLMLIR